MTREEVIKDLRYIKNMNHNSLWQSSAIDEAIKALENQKSIIEELEKIKEEIVELEKKMGQGIFTVELASEIVNDHIAELKGEKE